jgi:L-aminopeptidase/D-esterase-like protein
MGSSQNRGHITDIEGIFVGHETNTEHNTGTTVLLFSHPMPTGVDVRGGAPGTRETNVFSPLNLVETADAVVLSGGSAFGLDAASGLMRFLREQDRGVETGYGKVPIVPAAVIFDLPVSGGKVVPDDSWGYRAAASAAHDSTSRGNIGAGAGATVGKLYGMEYAVKSGVGSAVVSGAGGLRVGALCVVNALGDVIDPDTGKIIAGMRKPDGSEFLDARKAIHDVSFPFVPPISSTIIGAVAVNANLSKLDMNRVARMAHDGIARSVFPSHTMLDGDTLFACAAGGLDFVDITVCGALASLAVNYAISDAVLSVEGISGYPAGKEIGGT